MKTFYLVFLLAIESCALLKKQPSVTLKTSDPNIVVHQKNMTTEEILQWADSIHQIEIRRLTASRDSLLDIIQQQQEPYREHQHE